MKAIYASKFYKASPRKDAIKAALENPVNMELVTQLKSYLSDETLREIQPPEPVEPEKPEVSETEPKAGGTSKGGPSRPSGGHSAPPPSGGVEDDTLMDDIVDDFNNSEDTVLDEEAEATADALDEGIESVTDIDDEPEDLQDELDSLIHNCPDWVNDSVARTSIRHGDEYWIYFNDDTNLNKLMTPVIDALDSKLQFNRLARANNAIVFEIDESPIKTVDEVDTYVSSSGEAK